jgi:hypothetical protein
MRNGGHALTVVCKGTYDLTPGELRLAEQQEDPNEDDNFLDDDPRRSLQSASDLALFKVRADVVLVGKAFAPKQAPGRSLLARLSIAGVDKTIEVCADRSWTPEGGLREGPPFSVMPIRYERAAYGNDNPVGVHVDPQVGGPLPNLQPPGASRRPDAIPPIGFGPIAAQWPARRALLGRTAAGFSPRGWDEQPLPEDLDVSFFNVAPVDQRPERLEPGARLVLENLSPQHARLVTALPAARPRAFADRGGGLEELSLLCDTLWIDTDSAVCTITWRGQMGLMSRHDEGTIQVLLDHPNRPLTWEEIQTECANAAPPRAPRRVQPSFVEHEMTVVAEEQEEPNRTRAYKIGSAGLPALPFVDPGTAEAPPAPRPQPRPSTPPWLNVINLPQPTPPPGAGNLVSTWQYEEPPAAAQAPLPPPPPVPAVLPAPPPVPATAMPSGLQPLPPLPPPPAPVTVGMLAAAAAAPPPPAAEPAPASPSAVVRTPAKAAPVEILDLIGFDPSVPDRARVHPPWMELIVALRPVPAEADPDDEPDEDPPEVKDRRDVLGVLRQADPTPLDDLEAILHEAAAAPGGLTPPLVLVAGELEPAFDEVEALSAALAAAAPFAVGSDKKLKDAFDQVTESLKSSWVQGSPRAAEALSTRLREAFPQGAWSLPQGWLDQQIERAVVEKRAYQKRKVLGKTLLRAALGPRGAAVPAYLPEDLAGHLPLYARFSARAIAEVHLSQDQYEPHPVALRVLALARVVTPRSAPRPAQGKARAP